MTTTTTTNRWLELSEICAAFNTTSDKLGAASRRHYRYAGADTIEFYFEGGIMLRKQGKYQASRYRIVWISKRLVWLSMRVRGTFFWYRLRQIVTAACSLRGLSSNGTKNRVKTKLIISNLFRVIISCDLVTQNLTFASSASESRKPISDLAVTDVRFMLYQAASEGRSLFRSLVRKRALSHSRVVKISSRQWL